MESEVDYGDSKNTKKDEKIKKMEVEGITDEEGQERNGTPGQDRIDDHARYMRRRLHVNCQREQVLKRSIH